MRDGKECIDSYNWKTQKRQKNQGMLHPDAESTMLVLSLLLLPLGPVFLCWFNFQVGSLHVAAEKGYVSLWFIIPEEQNALLVSIQR